MNLKLYGKKLPLPILMYIMALTCRECGMPPKKLTQDSQSPVLDFNPGYLEYEVGCA
jgi:hypothetical protein